MRWPAVKASMSHATTWVQQPKRRMETNQQPGGIVRRNLKDAEMKAALIVVIIILVVCGVAILDVNPVLAGISFLLAVFNWFVLDIDSRHPGDVSKED
jgi:hypothetical protein